MAQTWRHSLTQEIETNGHDMGYFTLQDFYKTSERNLEILFPKNNTIKASIRRGLQELRDDGYLEFMGPGKYRVISKENDEWSSFINTYHSKR